MVAVLLASICLLGGCGRVTPTQAALATTPLGGNVLNNKLTGGGSAGLGTVSVTAGGPGALHGRVLDATQHPIVGAVVVIAQTGQRLTTDSTGVYRFSGLPEGNYSFTALASGLTQVTPTGILIQANLDTAVPDITMAPGNGPSGITNITYSQEGFFGSAGAPPGTLMAPLGLIVRGTDTLVLDTNHSWLVNTGVIRQYGDDGSFTGKFGDYSHIIGLPMMADTANAIALDGTSRAWVLDGTSNTLWAFNPDGSKNKKVSVNVDGGTSLTVDTSTGSMYIAGDGVTKLDGEGANPQKLENAGNVRAVAAGKSTLWGLADNKVEKLASDGSSTLEFGAGGTNVQDTFQDATAIAVDPRNGNVVVADNGTKNVYVYDTSGVLVGKVGDGVFENPIAVATDQSGRVFVLDGALKKVFKFLQTAVH